MSIREMIRKKETVISELNDKIVEEISEEDIQEETEEADSIENYIQGLEGMGQTHEPYGSFLVPIILNKFPGFVQQNMVRVHGNDRWNLQLLRDPIQQEITIQETEKLDSNLSVASMQSLTTSVRAQVLLKTAIVSSDKTHFSQANTLFDEGAQHSFITKNMAGKVNLKPVRK
ncbi:Hypothetical predicted protein [Mytilus galloprovincialis]|uniref:Uncharacterized protein n=1 Tax=Mytilus galloprovincialis TaxID=29158 RepID=A0A8B6HQU3_MYTGA|nr:Hypothetical predicted protein [Mytilus galloprovincialis]